MDTITQILVYAVPGILAVTVHEVAHGWAAGLLGDSTAADHGRLSLNPLRHVDPLGTVVVPLALYMLGGFFFGWAKPVPVRWSRLRPFKAGIAMVAAAGPGANLLMLAAWVTLAFGFTSMRHVAPEIFGVLIYMCDAGIIFNAAIMIINLLPIPPLDGSRIVTAVLPSKWAVLYNRVEVFGIAIVVLLIATGVLQAIVLPILNGLLRALSALGI